MTSPAPTSAENLAMLCETAGSVAEATGGREAVLEPKFDGERILVRVTENGVELYARSGNRKTHHLVPVCEELAFLPAGTWLDGEAVALGVEDGRVVHRWGGAQSVLGGNPKPRAQQETVTLILFDLLAHGGIDARPLPLSDRRSLLEAVIEGRGLRHVQIVPQLEATEENHQAILAAGFEGSVVKALGGRYQSAKRGWRRLKPQSTAECVVVGFKPGNGWRAGKVGALVLAQRDPDTGEWVERGSAGTGFTKVQIDEITASQDEWLGRVVEIRHHGVLGTPLRAAFRHPAFVRPRDDKAASEVVLHDC